MISWERVEEFRREVGEEDFDEVAEMFILEVEEMIAQMREKPDPNSLAENLHFLKGCALNLGFEAFSALCADGENRAAKEDPSGVDLDSIFSAYAASKAEFFAGRERLAS